MTTADYLDAVERRYLAAGRSVVAVVVRRDGRYVAFAREIGGDRIVTGPECDDATEAALGLAMVPARRGCESRRGP